MSKQDEEPGMSSAASSLPPPMPNIIATRQSGRRCLCPCPPRGIDDYSCIASRKRTLNIKLNLDVKLRPSRHDYLASSVHDIPRAITSRAIDTLMGRPHLPYDLERPFFKLESAQPRIFAPYVDKTRAKQAWGSWAIPKLCRELRSDDSIVVFQAINTILDMVKDPVWTVDAIRVGIISRIVELLLAGNDFERERAAMILQSVAVQAAGVEALLADKRSLTYLKRLIADQSEDVRHKALGAVLTVSRLWIGVITLVEKGFAKVLLRLIKKESSTTNLNFELEILYIVMDLEEAKKTVNEMGGYQVLLALVKKDDDACVMMRALGCLGHLCLLPKIRARALKENLLQLLQRLITHQHEDVQRRALGVVCNLSIATEAKNRLLEMDLLDLLIESAGNFHYPDMQINSIKILTNLAELEGGRISLLQEYRLTRIEQICCAKNDIIENYLTILINQIHWEP